MEEQERWRGGELRSVHDALCGEYESISVERNHAWMTSSARCSSSFSLPLVGWRGGCLRV